MILQVVYVDDQRVQLSDGMNTCYLNSSRPLSTIEAMCRKINKAAVAKDLIKSIFVFSDFAFDFDWDYDNKRLMVSLDTNDFDFLYPGCLHEKVFRSKDLTSVLGNLERETLKRTAMKKKLPASSCGDIDMGELIGITSSGGIVEEEIIATPTKQVLLPSTNHRSSKEIFRSHTEEGGPIMKSLMKNGWLTFPLLESENIPNSGGLFENIEEFIQKCKIISPDVSKQEEDRKPVVESSSNNLMNNLIAELPLNHAVAPKKEKPGPSSSKTRLRKDNFIVYKDMDESPIKGKPNKIEKSRGISKEDEAELEHLINITKAAKEPMKEEDCEPEPKKVMRKVKTNRPQAFVVKEKDRRSPAKVAVHQRIPQSDRNYSFRNREMLKSKEVF